MTCTFIIHRTPTADACAIDLATYAAAPNRMGQSETLRRSISSPNMVMIFSITRSGDVIGPTTWAVGESTKTPLRGRVPTGHGCACGWRSNRPPACRWTRFAPIRRLLPPYWCASLVRRPFSDYGWRSMPCSTHAHRLPPPMPKPRSEPANNEEIRFEANEEAEHRSDGTGCLAQTTSINPATGPAGNVPIRMLAPASGLEPAPPHPASPAAMSLIGLETGAGFARA